MWNQFPTERYEFVICEEAERICPTCKSQLLQKFKIKLCPHCGGEIERKPTDEFYCSNCKKEIIIREFIDLSYVENWGC